MSLSNLELLTESEEEWRQAPAAAQPTSGAGTERQGNAARFELKYLVPADGFADLKRDLLQFLAHDKHAGAAGGRQYTVRSLYFDTPNLRCYYDKLFGHNCRTKFRIRRYENPGVEPSDWFFEIKSKYHNACVKPRRLACSDGLLREHLRAHGTIHLNRLIDRLGQPVSQQAALWGLPLEPKVLVIYEREPLVDPRRPGFRVTFDAGVRAAFTGNPYAAIAPSRQLPLPVIMEVKFAHSMPSWLDAVIRKYRLDRDAISKYCHGVEAAFPLLGAARARAFSGEGVDPCAVGYLKNLLGLYTTGAWSAT